MVSKNVLIVDDVPDWPKTLSSLLSRLDYQVFIADNSNDALDIVQTTPVHLAILDVRLDEQDESNREGMALMHKIKAIDPNILIIILTGYADVSMVKEARNPRADGLAPAYAFIEKEDSDLIIERVTGAFADGMGVNWNLTIENLATFIEPLFHKIKFVPPAQKPPLTIFKQEIDHLLRKLFPDCHKIRLDHLQKGYGKAAVLSIQPFYKDKGPGEVVIAKIGDYTIIDEERLRYSQWVEGVVGGHRLPRQLNVQRTRSLGGLIYSFAGLGAIQDFATFYQARSLADITAVLESLFLETCFPASRTAAVYRPDFNFTAHYTAQLNLRDGELNEALAHLVANEAQLRWQAGDGSDLLFAGQHRLPNPVRFIQETSISGEAHLVTVHGDLTPYNILVDHHHEAWLIDFSHTGQGHLLQDFARLEVFLKLATASDYDLHTLFAWEKIGLDDLTTFELPSDFACQDTLRKLTATLAVIRRLAHALTPNSAPQEYAIALLFNTVKTIKYLDIPIITATFATLSAALLCEGLKTDKDS